MSPAACRADPSRSSSTSAIVTDTATGDHLLKIGCYSRIKATTPTGSFLSSAMFTVGGHRWRIDYYPNGESADSADYISLFLLLDEKATKNVKVQAQFKFQISSTDQVKKAPSLASTEVNTYGEGSSWGRAKFIKREDFEKSNDLRDDSFVIRCDVAVIGEIRTEITTTTFVAVPPPELNQQLGDLLETEKGADVVFQVGDETFAAHRLVLAARSPVFSAELYGLMKEGDTAGVVRIGDMEAQVFKLLLRFVYTETLPEMEEEDVMCQHLLVAADRYNLQRLKLVCEGKLCRYIAVGTVGNILALADQHHCAGLKKACFHFLGSQANLSAVIAADGFEHLSRSCPTLMKELNSGEQCPAMATAACGESPSRLGSASAIVADTETRYHLLKIGCYSRTKATTPTGSFLSSGQFTVGGHRWRIQYYPNGERAESANYISLYLLLDEKATNSSVKVQAQFKFQISSTDQVKKPPSLASKEVNKYGGGSYWSWGHTKFITREDFEKSNDLRDDSFTIRCDVATTEIPAATTFVTVSPSDLNQQLVDLLETEKGADVVFEVSGETFAAHRCLLAARSPVFSAELYGLMKEGDTAGVVRIEDMEAQVFKLLLRFMYTDSLPKMEEEDVMWQHLLVAADRYDLQRLNLICDDRLCNYIGVSTVLNILVLADQHHCDGLKKACFSFLGSPENLSAVVTGDGLEHLSRTCPSLMKELFVVMALPPNHGVVLYSLCIYAFVISILSLQPVLPGAHAFFVWRADLADEGAFSSEAFHVVGGKGEDVSRRIICRSVAGLTILDPCARGSRKIATNRACDCGECLRGGSLPRFSCRQRACGLVADGKVPRLVSFERATGIKALVSLFVMVCWLIWKECNARIFEQRSRTAGQLFSGIREEIMIWKEAGVFRQCD
uniref:BTB domain-containing protein n=1 Tax=Oryza meridionalis TaxID=40149 RepID=A0A0E0EY43_9ORYZ